jgi:hypothetical protein
LPAGLLLLYSIVRLLSDFKLFSNTQEKLKNPGNNTGIQPTLPLGLAAAAGALAATAFLACWPAAAV